MSSMPPEVSARLSTLNRQMRCTSLQREVTYQAVRRSEMSVCELEQARNRLADSKRAMVRRLMTAIDQCDLLAAEAHLQEVLSLSARLQGCEG